MTALYACRITHVRTSPFRNVFSYPGYLWLVDLDHLPPGNPLARFDPGARADVDAFLAGHGVTAGRILMLAGARTLGYVFNPLTLYWCDTGHVIAEVHNTYGGRHRYLVRPDARGRAEAVKQLYVSPFHPVDGHYRMRLPEPGERLDLTVTLHRPEGRPFTATVRGERVPVNLRNLLRASPLLVGARIRRRGIGLYLRGLPVIPREKGP
ncbi:DUF1365 domain-containing protein [Acrocarpospora phusangensis]|uniref:DUF1365 domain-containing protein n=1 Tax=Acrocarpospora phusangensis TaxID=1070424 RepID=A0A919UQG4_9ACTN|nr:DUF1365 domain-containing protein [Acrocarpospora phusangensis]GIH26388.1 DUF1365 domain-containing protein [Acrocarpospora phusangensis]